MNAPPQCVMKRKGISDEDTKREKQNKKKVLEQSALCPKALTDCLYSKKKSKTNGGKRTYKKRRRKRKTKKNKRSKRRRGKKRKTRKRRKKRR